VGRNTNIIYQSAIFVASQPRNAFIEIRFNPAFVADHLKSREELNIQFEGKSSNTEPAGVSGEIGSPDCGESLAFNLGGDSCGEVHLASPL
jgi:hypothetical protein